MRYKQTFTYQNIKGGGRDCTERWGIIEKYVPENTQLNFIDIGSAEGFFAKKLAEKSKGNVISIDGSDMPYKTQKEYCKDEINNGTVKLFNIDITEYNLGVFLGKEYECSLLLAILHWCENPDYILRKMCEKSKYTFVEIPELTDNQAFGQDYLKRIREDFGDTKTYMETISGKKVIAEHRVGALTTKQRTLFIIG